MDRTFRNKEEVEPFVGGEGVAGFRNRELIPFARRMAEAGSEAWSLSQRDAESESAIPYSSRWSRGARHFEELEAAALDLSGKIDALISWADVVGDWDG